MSIHKAWQWTQNTNKGWYTPSEEAYYLVHRWKNKGYTAFLDLGCGLGRHSFLFAQNGFSVDACDLSESAVDEVKRRAQEEHMNVSATTADMDALPYDQNSFDCLLAYHVISHTDTAGIKKIVAQIKRVLKPDGEYFVTLCSKNTWSYKEAGFPVHDENTVIKIEDGPENGIPHFFADETIVYDLFPKEELISVKHTQELIVDGKDYGSWHYFVLGKKNKNAAT
ncbi:class I SAM-dependent methyltransferase [Treponema lecithinolyticum]|uniref:Methyltransferase domain protein n=1 Tax=Treponema lecithinolyticum ATCC 700332 TaxID=1321815 RepID=A0ABN0NZI0_TRELE|nr:class I SAM-dependent methyltransferase [Treponema lecithinolyticum]ERJ93487.1 methyltransferase domain protein [Treponema lecithinolyticum ATCC 700332]